MRFALVLLLFLSACGGGGDPDDAGDPDVDLESVMSASTAPAYIRHEADGIEPYLMHCAPRARKIVLFLHSWESTGRQALSVYPNGIPDACVVSPNFNGKNNRFDAIGHVETLRRIDLALRDAQRRTGLRTTHLIGVSAGSMAGLNYMGAYPNRIQRASLWLVLYDLELFYRTTTDQGSARADMNRVLGPPSEGDEDYAARSPSRRLNGITPAVQEVHLNAGLRDKITVREHLERARRHLELRKVRTLVSYHDIGHIFREDQQDEAVRQLLD